MTKGRKMRTSLLAVLAVAFVFALGGSAIAQTSPTRDAYGGVLGNEAENNVNGNVATQELGDNAGSLPFTGFEAGLVAFAGFGLVALGFAIRRSTRRPPA
jgi:hypothetical protein